MKRFSAHGNIDYWIAVLYAKKASFSGTHSSKFREKIRFTTLCTGGTASKKQYFWTVGRKLDCLMIDAAYEALGKWTTGREYRVKRPVSTHEIRDGICMKYAQRILGSTYSVDALHVYHNTEPSKCPVFFAAFILPSWFFPQLTLFKTTQGMIEELYAVFPSSNGCCNKQEVNESRMMNRVDSHWISRK